jgi:hypothetical protein
MTDRAQLVGFLALLVVVGAPVAWWARDDAVTCGLLVGVFASFGVMMALLYRDTHR